MAANICKRLCFIVINLILALLIPIILVTFYSIVSEDYPNKWSLFSWIFVIIYILLSSWFFIVLQLGCWYKIVENHNQKYTGNLWLYRGLKTLKVISCGSIVLIDPAIIRLSETSQV